MSKELATVRLKKLKNILLCSILLTTCIVVYTCLKREWYVPKEEVREARIIDFEITGDTLKLELKKNQKYIAYYQITSLEEKEWLIKNLEYEMILSFQGKYQQPSTNTNFYQFSYRNYLKSQNIHWQIQITKIERLQKSNSLKSLIKNSIQKRINQIHFNDTYLSLFLLGSQKNYDDEIYRKLGVSHLFCISGMHFSFFLVFFCCFFKDRRKAQLFSFPVMLFYAWIIGFSVSVIRVLGSMLFSISPAKKYLSHHEFYVLFFCILLCLNSYRIYDIGFLYSFVVSDALILFAHSFQKKNTITKFFTMSLISFMASIPITITSQYELQFTSILWNMIYIPFVSYLLFPLSFLVFIFPICFPIFSWLLSILEYSNQFFESLLPSAIIFRKPPYWFYVLFIFCFYTKKSLRWKIVTVTCLLCILKGTTYIYPAEFVMFDVGQGDSMLIRGEKVILVDTGGKLEYQKEAWQKKKTSSYAERVIIPYLKATGITKIDYLVLTHGDYDHMGESISLVENFPVRHVIFNHGSYNDLEQKLMKQLQRKNIDYVRNVKTIIAGNLQLQFLNHTLYDNENDNSSVIYLKFGKLKTLLMGDASTKVETALLEQYQLNDVDILKVGHHGSKTSTSKEFMNVITPQYAFISVGKNNRYGHPDHQVLNHLKKSHVFRTDEQGSIIIKQYHNRYEIKTCIN